MSVELGVLCTIIGVAIGYLGYRRNGNKDIQEDAKTIAFISTKLDYISNGVADIKADMRAQDKKISDLSDKVIRIEESTKSAHKRLDTIEKEGV
ncbi:hypothetical protein KQI86_19320 [Clostridium sp. MSJ-11]|uniref:Uncharacterized protein n=1 Tax=Clostridium mobile TaxID=2841512 RepID=A0ABS6EN56_9CLOT|nr:hypothetical protein [Clostridium mobile]MBU5486455.1 hypothetical protein [Clostridium mobile]